MTDPAARRCPNGHVVVDGQAFCGHCGESISRPERDDAEREPAAQVAQSVSSGGSDDDRERLVHWIILGLFTLVVVVVIVGGLVSSQDSQEDAVERDDPSPPPTVEQPYDRCLDDLLGLLTEADDSPSPETVILTRYGSQDRRTQFLVRVYAQSLSDAYRVGTEESVQIAVDSVAEYCTVNAASDDY